MVRNSDSAYSQIVASLFDGGRDKPYPKNQLIHYQGDPLSQIYMIKGGFVKAYTILDSGDTRTILFLSKGDIFPLAFSETMDWGEHKIRYFYQSMTEVELSVVAASDMQAKINSDAKALAIYMNYLSASNQAVMEQLEVMKNKKAIDKVAMLLPYLVSKAGRKIRPGVYELGLKLSHQEVADLSGVTRETTTTLVKQLEKENIIDQKHGNWVINLNNLEKHSHIS
jgi:CRP/FNR family transcriptional regulator